MQLQAPDLVLQRQLLQRWSVCWSQQGEQLVCVMPLRNMEAFEHQKRVTSDAVDAFLRDANQHEGGAQGLWGRFFR